MTNQTDFERNDELDQDAEQLAELLKSAHPGVLVPYDDMTVLLHRTVTSQEPALRKALKNLWDKGITFDNEPSVGYRRRDNDAEFSRGNKNRLGIHRRFKKARTEVRLVNRQQLDPTHRPLQDARQAFFETGARTSHGNSVRATARKNTTERINITDIEKERLERVIKRELSS